MPNPGKRKAQISKQPHVRAARARACGSGAAAAAAASEGGTGEMEIDDALSLADEAQRQLEADAVEMNAEHEMAVSDGSVALPVCWLLFAPPCSPRLLRPDRLIPCSQANLWWGPLAREEVAYGGRGA